MAWLASGKSEVKPKPRCGISRKQLCTSAADKAVDPRAQDRVCASLCCVPSGQDTAVVAQQSTVPAEQGQGEALAALPSPAHCSAFTECCKELLEAGSAVVWGHSDWGTPERGGIELHGGKE